MPRIGCLPDGDLGKSSLGRFKHCLPLTDSLFTFDTRGDVESPDGGSLDDQRDGPAIYCDSIFQNAAEHVNRPPRTKSRDCDSDGSVIGVYGMRHFGGPSYRLKKLKIYNQSSSDNHQYEPVVDHFAAVISFDPVLDARSEELTTDGDHSIDCLLNEIRSTDSVDVPTHHKIISGGRDTASQLETDHLQSRDHSGVSIADGLSEVKDVVASRLFETPEDFFSELKARDSFKALHEEACVIRSSSVQNNVEDDSCLVVESIWRLMNDSDDPFNDVLILTTSCDFELEQSIILETLVSIKKKLPPPPPVTSDDSSDALILEKVWSEDPFDDIFYFTTEFDFKVDQHQVREALQSISSRIQERHVFHAPPIPMIEITNSDFSNISVDTMQGTQDRTKVKLFKDNDPRRDREMIDCNCYQKIVEEVQEATFAPVRESIESFDSSILSVVDTQMAACDDENGRITTPKLLNNAVHPGLNRKLVGCPTYTNRNLDGVRRPYGTTVNDITASGSTDSTLDPFDDIFYFTTEFDFKVDQQQLREALQSIHDRHQEDQGFEVVSRLNSTMWSPSSADVESTGNGVLTTPKMHQEIVDSDLNLKSIRKVQQYASLPMVKTMENPKRRILTLVDSDVESSDERIGNFVGDDAMAKSKLQDQMGESDLHRNVGSLSNNAIELEHLQPTSSVPLMLMDTNDASASGTRDSILGPFDDVIDSISDFNFKVDQQQLCEAPQAIDCQAQEGQYVDEAKSSLMMAAAFAGATPHARGEHKGRHVLLNANSGHKIINAVEHPHCTFEVVSNLTVDPNSTLLNDFSNLCALKETDGTGPGPSLALPIQRKVASETFHAVGELTYQSTRSIGTSIMNEDLIFDCAISIDPFDDVVYFTTDGDYEIHHQSSVIPVLNSMKSRVHTDTVPSDPVHQQGIHSTTVSLAAIETKSDVVDNGSKQMELGLVYSIRDEDQPRTPIWHESRSTPTAFNVSASLSAKREHDHAELTPTLSTPSATSEHDPLSLVKDNMSIEQTVMCEPDDKDEQQYRKALRSITMSILSDDMVYVSSESDSFADVSYFTTDLDYEINQNKVDAVVRSIQSRVQTSIVHSNRERLPVTNAVPKQESLSTIVDHMESSILTSKRDETKKIGLESSVEARIDADSFTENKGEGLWQCIHQGIVDETLLYQSSKNLSPKLTMSQEFVGSKSDAVDSHPDPMEFLFDSALVEKNDTYAEEETFGDAILKRLAALDCLGRFDDGPNTMVCLMNSAEDSLSADSLGVTGIDSEEESVYQSTYLHQNL